MIVVQVRINRDVHAELFIANVTGEKGSDKINTYQITNIYGKPTFQVMDNSSWDKVVIPAIETAMKAYKRQGDNPERNL